MVESTRFSKWFAVAVLMGALCAGCGALGWELAPGSSSKDEWLFAAPPVVVHRGSGYALSWTYGKAGFYFAPHYRAVDERLVFSLQGTSSSGSLSGRRFDFPIEGPSELRALSRGGAWWWEPDGSYVRLDVIEE